jgi:hypothetical protein
LVLNRILTIKLLLTLIESALDSSKKLLRLHLTDWVAVLAVLTLAKLVTLLAVVAVVVIAQLQQRVLE